MQRLQLMKMAKSFDGKSAKSHSHPARHDGLSYIESIERPALMRQAEAEAGRVNRTPANESLYQGDLATKIRHCR
jgi:hypothetical protein